VSAIRVIVKRELQAYFVSPIAYTVCVIFLLIASLGFVMGILQYSMIPEHLAMERGLNIRTFIISRMVLWMSFGMMLSLPALSMRQFAEEKKGGTAELLMTSPLTTANLVLGKYLGSLSILALMLLLTTPFLWILLWQATPEWPAFVTMYAGLFLYGAVILSVGLFSSSLTENQIVALILTYVLWLPFWLVELAVGYVGGTVGDVIAAVSVGIGLRGMSQGLVDTHFIVLDLALISLFLFLCVQVLDSSRWR
jgi:ABC-2 type transport system permease protein